MPTPGPQFAVPLSRRKFLTSCAGGAAVLSLNAAPKPPHVLLRSSWQTVNSGDIAHTPGALKLLTTYLPDAQLTLWASEVDRGVDAMLLNRCPKLRIVKGTISDDGKASNAARQEALASCDMLLHSSGASLVAAKEVAAFSKHTGKPFGGYGIMHGSFFSSGEEQELLISKITPPHSASSRKQ